ncbi:taste receptor type 2 member 140-like [Lithobates pipiens]
MNESTEEIYYAMNSIQHPFAFGYLGITILAGLVIHLFIVNVNLIDWMKGRSMTGADKIITSIGISRILFQMMGLLFSIVQYYQKFPIIFQMFASYTMYSSDRSNIYLSTLLSIFLYFKISTFHSTFFLRLKDIIYLIIAPIMFSFGYTSMYLLVTQSTVPHNSTKVYFSYDNQKQKIMLYLKSLCDIFLFLMIFITSYLLIILLGIHMNRMNNCGNVTSSTDAYSRTLKFTVASILIWSIHFITSMIDAYMRFLDFMWSFFITIVITALHSVLLIYVSTKLRNQFFRIVHCWTDCLFNRKVPGPHSIETMEETPL